MFVADNLVGDMLYSMPHYSVERGIITYRISLVSGDYTEIIGEWIWPKNGLTGDAEGFFLVHSWNNNVNRHVVPAIKDSAPVPALNSWDF